MKITFPPDMKIEASGLLDHIEQRCWFEEQLDAGKSVGLVWHRFSVHPSVAGRVMYEGWLKRPPTTDSVPESVWEDT